MSRLSLLLLATILGIALLTLSFPRLRASIAYLPAETALRNHWDIRPIRQERFPALIDAARESIDILDDSQYWYGLAWLQYLYVESLGFDTPKGKQMLLLSQRSFETLLKSSPASPREWLRLGWIHSTLDHPASEVIDAWRMSVHTGRAEHHLYLNRLNLGLRYADFLDEEDLALLRDQLLLTWRYQRREMEKSIASDRLDFKTILALLYRDAPEVLAEIEEAYVKSH